MATRFKTRWELEEEDHEMFLKKKEEELQRRRAKREAEGFKCTKEGCGQAFHDYIEFQAHVKEHQDECRKNMICNQAKCGQKFNNRRAYNEHIEAHKEGAKAKALRNIRSVLLLNKHGLLMESFEREFKSVMGKPVPYKMMGYNSAYDLVTNIPEVVKVTQLNGGQTLLVAVPDEACEHIAKMVGNQRFNRDGFNYRNGEVLSSVGRDVLKKIEKLVDKSNRTVPDFMKKQIQQLLDLDVVEGGEGIGIDEFREIYDEEFGYALEFHSYGFHSMEDFIHHGLAGMVDLKLERFSWKVVAVGCSLTTSDPVLQTIGQDIKQNVRKLMEENPFGMSVMTLVRLYEELFGRLELRQSRCSKVAELCLLMPDICKVHESDTGEVTILPAGAKVSANTTSTPIWVLGEVKNNIWKLLSSLSRDVPLSTFVRGYEGLYGLLCLPNLQYGSVLELCRDIPDVCILKTGQNREFTISKASTVGTASFKLSGVPSRVKENIVRVLHKCGGRVKLENFFREYLETNGVSLNPRKLGFKDLKCLFENLLDDARIKVSKEMVTLTAGVPKSTPVSPYSMSSTPDIPTGWVNIATVVSPELIYLRTDSMTNQLWGLEEKMEQYYTVQKSGQLLAAEDMFIGQVVAAVGADTLWHRGRVDMIKAGVVKIFFLDFGHSAMIKASTLRHLPPQFCSDGCLAVAMKLGRVAFTGKGWDRKTVMRLQDIIKGGNERCWVQRIKGEEVDMFVMTPNKQGLGKMVAVSKVLVESGLAVHCGGAETVLDREKMWDFVKTVSKPVMSDVMAMQRLVLAKMIMTSV